MAGDFHRPYETLNVSHFTIHRTTLPQSALRAASSLREGAGKRSHSTGYSLNRKGGGRFSSPLRNSECFTFYHSSNDTPSVTPVGRASSLREGTGNGCFHSSGYSLNRNVAGDFHRPYATQKILAFTIHRGTLPQSRPLGVPAPSGREPGTPSSGRVPFIVPPGNRNVAGDFHRPSETQSV